jgi:carboxypeptidase C (cathepsin A)
MVQKHIKKCSTSLVIRKIKIKTTLRFYLTPVRMAKIKKTQAIADAGKDVEKEQYSSIVDGIASCYNHCRNQFGNFSENWTKCYYLWTQLCHSSAYTQKMLQHITRTHVLLCS